MKNKLICRYLNEHKQVFYTKSMRSLLSRRSLIDAITGTTPNCCQNFVLKEAFKVKTVVDLAKLKFVKWAQAICTLAYEEFYGGKNECCFRPRYKSYLGARMET